MDFQLLCPRSIDETSRTSDHYFSSMSDSNASDGHASPEEYGSSEEASPTPSLEEHQEFREVEPSVQMPTTVVQAIHSAGQDRLYTLLLELVTTIPAAKALAEERLLVPIQANDRPEARPLKRKAYEICKNCKGEYSVENNYKGSCVYHSEKYKTVNYDSDIWADHDDACHGPPEAHENDPDYDEGFWWECCEEDGGSIGCVVSRHEPKEDEASNKARKILQPISRNVVHGVVNGTAAAGAFRGPGGRAVM
ncbi:hypothetical protein BST61_g10014 [Cercospora zeina]